jgi:hypothetical protein
LQHNAAGVPLESCQLKLHCPNQHSVRSINHSKRLACLPVTHFKGQPHPQPRCLTLQRSRNIGSGWPPPTVTLPLNCISQNDVVVQCLHFMLSQSWSCIHAASWFTAEKQTANPLRGCTCGDVSARTARQLTAEAEGAHAVHLRQQLGVPACRVRGYKMQREQRPHHILPTNNIMHLIHSQRHKLHSCNLCASSKNALISLRFCQRLHRPIPCPPPPPPIPPPTPTLRRT